MRNLVLTALASIFMWGCQTLRVDPSQSNRCVANVEACEALLLPEDVARATVSFPAGDPFPLSPITRAISRNLSLLNVPFELVKYPQADAGPVAIELTFTQFLEVYEDLPGGRELISILSAANYRSADELRTSLSTWLSEYVPGYTLEWDAKGDSTFIEQGEFFDSLERKVIPIANHHDLLVHLFLYADPEIRKLTERLIANYEKAVRYSLRHKVGTPSADFSDVLNSIWVKLQENTPLQYKDRRGNIRIAIVGGYPSVVDPLQSYGGYLLDWIYFADFDKILAGLEHEIKNKAVFSRRSEAQKLYVEIVRQLSSVLSLPAETSLQELGESLDQKVDAIDAEFNAISQNHPLYQDRWIEFSKAIRQDDKEPGLTALRPQYHRQLLDKTITLVELILSE